LLVTGVMYSTELIKSDKHRTSRKNICYGKVPNACYLRRFRGELGRGGTLCCALNSFLDYEITNVKKHFDIFSLQ